MPGQHIHYNKTSQTAKAAGTWHSLFTATGLPGAGTLPTGAGAGAIPTSATAGVFTFTNPTSPSLSYLARLSGVGTAQATLILYDRVWHGGGYNSNSAVSQTVTSTALTRYTGGDDIELWVEWSGVSGNTTSNLTVTYTNQAGTGSRTSQVLALQTASVAGQMQPVALQAGDTGMRAIASIILSASMVSGTATILGLVMMRRIAEIPLVVANVEASKNNFDLGMPQVQDNAALSFFTQVTGTATGQLLGAIEIVQG